MKKHLSSWLPVVCILILLAACVPYSFSPPTQIHITSGDHVDQAVISVDAEGRSHIAGVVDGRVVYTRTTFGDLKTKLTMTMDSESPGWYQYEPDIAATDIGTAWIVWTEQRGDANKIACYRVVTTVPPPGGFNTSCLRLDSTFFSTGNVMVVARGSQAYALYDAIDPSGGVDALWYKELTHPSNTGIIYSYTAHSESGFLHSWDAGIDSEGYLHVAFLDEDGSGNERLMYRSNAEIYGGGTMKQGWFILDSDQLEQDTPISMSFHMNLGQELMAIAAAIETDGKDNIWIYRCTASGCSLRPSVMVNLPPVWSSQSMIKDLELLGLENELHLGFIGDSSATTISQVFYMRSAFSSDSPALLSDSRVSYKYDLEATKVDPRPESSSAISFATLSWGERGSDSTEYYSFDGTVLTTKVFTINCLTSQVDGESASNGVYHAGVFKACEDTWFTTQANSVYLPVISK